MFTWILFKWTEVNFLVVNSATFLEIGNFRFIQQFSGFSAHFLMPAWASQLAHFCKSEIFVWKGIFSLFRQSFGTKKLTSVVNVFPIRGTLTRSVLLTATRACLICFSHINLSLEISAALMTQMPKNHKTSPGRADLSTFYPAKEPFKFSVCTQVKRQEWVDL